MLNTIKRIPGLRMLYHRIDQWHQNAHAHDEGRRLFENYDVLFRALEQKGKGPVYLHTHDGLTLIIRQNLWDARIVREIFCERPYLRHLALPPHPTIIDVGAYIGDFALYAAKYLNARVLAYEPTVENYALLAQNVALNRLTNLITAIPLAVSNRREVTLNVQITESEEVHVSSHLYPNAEVRRIPSVTVADIVNKYHLSTIDLLKLDCEGGEYEILNGIPVPLFQRIGNIVFEYHRINNYKPQLDTTTQLLRSVGFTLQHDDNIVSAFHT